MRNDDWQGSEPPSPRAASATSGAMRTPLVSSLAWMTGTGGTVGLGSEVR